MKEIKDDKGVVKEEEKIRNECEDKIRDGYVEG